MVCRKLQSYEYQVHVLLVMNSRGCVCSC